MSTTNTQLQFLAEELTASLGIAFRAGLHGVEFDGPLQLSDWSVPLIFDGHVAHWGGALVPVDFVGHILWAALRRVTGPGDGPSWWSCELSAFAAQCILEDCTGEDETSLDDDLDGHAGWSGGRVSGL